MDFGRSSAREAPGDRVRPEWTGRSRPTSSADARLSAEYSEPRMDLPFPTRQISGAVIEISGDEGYHLVHTVGASRTTHGPRALATVAVGAEPRCPLRRGWDWIGSELWEQCLDWVLLANLRGTASEK
jgi:hypothetical protein